MKKLSFLVLALTVGLGCSRAESQPLSPSVCGGGTSASVPVQPATPSGRPAVSLGHESSGEFFRQALKDPSGKYIAEERIAYTSGCLATLLYNGPGKLSAFRLHKNEVLVADGTYAPDGRKLVSRRNYSPVNGSLESAWHQVSDGERYLFYSNDGSLAREVFVAADGSERTITYAAGRVPETISYDAGAVCRNTVELRAGWRLTYTTVGRRVSSWELAAPNGRLDHKGQFLDGGDIELTSFDLRGLVSRKQRFAFVGEDCNRPYYRLASMQGFWDDGRTVRFDVELHPSGNLKRIVANHRSGSVDIARDFDQEGRTIRVDRFEASGAQSSSHVYESGRRPRGFTPANLRDIPGAAIADLYDFGGTPFAVPGPSGTAHPLFKVR